MSMKTASIKETMQNFAIQQALGYIEGNPEENIPKLMALSDKLLPEGWYGKARDAIRTSIDEKDNWYQLILKISVWLSSEAIRQQKR